MSGKIAITFGRFNPMQVGHEKLVHAVMKAAPIARVYLSHSQNANKDPLSYKDKIHFATMAFGPIITESPARTIIEVMKELEHQQFSDIIVVVGSDRVQEFETLLLKYNGKEYHFNSIKVISAGERDPDAEGVAGMSASKMRAAAVAGDFAKFKSGAPSRLTEKEVRQMFDKVREGMGLNEEDNLVEGISHTIVASYGAKDPTGAPKTYLVRKNIETGEHKAMLVGHNGVRQSHRSVFGGHDAEASAHGAKVASLASKGKHNDAVSYLNKHTGMKWSQNSIREEDDLVETKGFHTVQSIGDGKFVVVHTPSGRVKSQHNSREEAEAAAKALKESVDLEEGYVGRETAEGKWRVFETGKSVAVAGPFASAAACSEWIKNQKKSTNEGSEYDEEFGEFEFSDDELLAGFASLDYDAISAAADAEDMVGDEEDDGDEEYEGMEEDGEEEDDVYPTCPGCSNENCPDCNPESMEDMEEAVLTFQQRLKRARALKVREPKLKRMRMIAAQKMAGGKSLLRRARHAAISLLKKKVAGTRGAHYDKLSPSEKSSIDRAVQNRMKMVGRIAQRLLPMVRKKEQMRLQRIRAHGEHLPANERKESFDMSLGKSLKVVAEAVAKKKSTDGDDSDNGEADAHIIMLLRKSVSLRGLKDVKFNDGNTVRVPAAEAQAALNLFNAAKTSIEKGQIQKKLAASYDSLKTVIGGK